MIQLIFTIIAILGINFHVNCQIIKLHEIDESIEEDEKGWIHLGKDDTIPLFFPKYDKTMLLSKIKYLQIVKQKGNLDINTTILFAENLKALSIRNEEYLKPSLTSVLLDSSNIIWKLPELEFLEESIKWKRNGQEYNWQILYYIKKRLLIIRNTPKIRCEDFQKIFFLDAIKHVYLNNQNILEDTCLCKLKNLEWIMLGYTTEGTYIKKVQPCLANLPKLHYLDLYGAGKETFSLSNNDFDIFQMSKLDTLNVEYAALKPKIKDIKLDSIKYLKLGLGNYPQSYASRLRNKLRSANVQLWQEDNWAKKMMRIGYHPDIGNSKVIKHLALDICYLPAQSMRISLGIQNFFNRDKDKYGTSYTGGTHIFNFNTGVIITPQYSTKVMAETRYDYLLPRFPIFFGLGFNAYVDVKTGDFRAYVRPRIGLTFTYVSLWYSHGIPLAPTYMENVPAYEIGITFFIHPIKLIPFAWLPTI